jgi:hypothetical protein
VKGDEAEREQLLAELDAVEAQVGRTHVTAGVLAGLSGGALVAALVTLIGGELPAAAAGVGWAAAVAFVAATVAVALAVRPARGTQSGQPYGWAAYLGRTPLGVMHQLERCWQQRALAERLTDQCALVARKYRLISLAVDAALLGLGLACVAAVLAVALRGGA